MSRIEEALRRARLSVIEEAAPDVHSEPPPAAEHVSLQDAVNDVMTDVVNDVIGDPAVMPPEPPTPVHAEVRIDPVIVPEARTPQRTLEQHERLDTFREPLREPRNPDRPTNEKLIVNAGVAPAVLEQYRKAAASLHQLQLDRGIKIVMIASAIAEDGKTITASNIALTLSESFKRRVLLIDADLRRPSVHQMFGTPNASGLNDALNAEKEQKLTIFQVTPTLSILPSGRPNPDPMSSLSSDRMRKILAEAGTKFDWVVIDTPPVGVLADAKLLAEMVDAVVLVIGAGRTPFAAIERAIQAIDRKRIAGVVLNRVVEQPSAYHYYQYYAGASPRA